MNKAEKKAEIERGKAVFDKMQTTAGSLKSRIVCILSKTAFPLANSALFWSLFILYTDFKGESLELVGGPMGSPHIYMPSPFP